MPALCGGCYYLCFQIMKMRQGIGDASDRLFVPLPQVTCWNLITKKLMLGKLEPLGKQYERTLLSQVGQMSLNKRPGRAYFLLWACKDVFNDVSPRGERKSSAIKSMHCLQRTWVLFPESTSGGLPPTPLAPGDPAPFWSVRAFVLMCI